MEGVEKEIRDLLEESQTRDDLLRAGKAGAGELLTALISLELRGLIKEEFGSWHRT